MVRVSLFTAVLLAGLVPAMPAAAQERVLTVFGEDACPANTICVRAPEKDRYRIPKHLRGPSQAPQSQSWAVRSQSALTVGKTGAGSCSAVGGAGWSGCFNEEMAKFRAEAEAARAEARAEP